MAIAIADTSPLQYLFQVGLVELLPSLFLTIQVPQAVVSELEIGRSLGYDVPDPAAYSWMVIRSTITTPAVDRFELGRGERAVLALALEIGDSLVLLDDAAARAAAKRLGVPATGTLGLLLLGKQQGLIATLAPVIARLAERGFHITEAVRRHVLSLASE